MGRSERSKIVGPELVQETMEKIRIVRERMKAAQSRQKAYADKRQRPLEFTIGDKLFLKMSPMKGVVRTTRRNKLNPRYMGPFEVLERIRPLAYRLALPQEIEKIHNVFHIFQLRKYVPDPSHILSHSPLHIRENLSYTEEPVQILDYKLKQLRNKTISLVKVLWRGQKLEEATWEPEEEMQQTYPHLFQAKLCFEDETLKKVDRM